MHGALLPLPTPELMPLAKLAWLAALTRSSCRQGLGFPGQAPILGLSLHCCSRGSEQHCCEWRGLLFIPGGQSHGAGCWEPLRALLASQARLHSENNEGVIPPWRRGEERPLRVHQSLHFFPLTPTVSGGINKSC